MVNHLGGGNAGTVVLHSEVKAFFPSIDQLKSLATYYSFDNEGESIFQEIVQALETDNKIPFDWSLQEAHHLENNPQETWLDYIIYRFKFSEFPKRLIETNFPVYLKVEPVSTCNLRCVMCFQIDKSFTKKPFMGQMDLDLFKLVID